GQNGNPALPPPTGASPPAQTTAPSLGGSLPKSIAVARCPVLLDRYDPVQGRCVPRCPSGERYDFVDDTCVAERVTSNANASPPTFELRKGLNDVGRCPLGQWYDVPLDKCVALRVTTRCGLDEVYNSPTGTCLKLAGLPSLGGGAGSK